RERKASIEVIVGDRKVPGSVSPPLPVIGVSVQRDEMHRGADASLLKLFDDLISVNAERLRVHQYDVKVPGVLDVRLHLRRLESIQKPKRLRVSLRQRHAASPHGVALGKLNESQGCLDVGEVIFVA